MIENNDENKPLTFSSKEFEPEKYQAVTLNACLRDLRLVSSMYNAKLSEFRVDQPDDAHGMQQAFTGEPGEYHLSPDRGIVAGAYRWNAEIRNGRKKVLRSTAEYFLLYSDVQQCEPDYVRMYFMKIARFASYPYFRAHFASQVAASGLKIAPLPSLNERID